MTEHIRTILLILLLSILSRANGDVHQLSPAGITYVNGQASEDVKAGPRSAQLNNLNNYETQNHQSNQGENGRYIIQSNVGAPSTIQTIYSSSTPSSTIGYNQNNGQLSAQYNTQLRGGINYQDQSSQQLSNSQNQNHNSAQNGRYIIQSNGAAPSIQTIYSSSSSSPFIGQDQSNLKYFGQYNNANTQVTTPSYVFAAGQQPEKIIQSSSLSPGYQTTTGSSESSFESSSQTSSSNKQSAQYSSQTTTDNPIYQNVIQDTTPYTTRFDNSQQGLSKYSTPLVINYETSTPASTIQTYETSTGSSSNQHSSSTQSSSQKSSFISSTTEIPSIHHVVNHQQIPISMSVTPAPYTISVSTPQSYGISNAPVPITPVIPTVPITPVAHAYKPIGEVHHVPVVTDIPVTHVQEHHGVVQKTVNVAQPGVKTQTYEIRRPAIQKQFYDIEERVVVRPAGSVVVEIEQPLSKTAKGGEVITSIGNRNSQGIIGKEVVNTVEIGGHQHNTNTGNIHNYQQNINKAFSGYNQQAFNTGGNSYQHVVGAFNHFALPNICDQFNQKFTAIPAFGVQHPGVIYVGQKNQYPNHGFVSSTVGPIHTTSAPLKNENDDSVIIDSRNDNLIRNTNEKYIDSTTQASENFPTTTELPVTTDNVQDTTAQSQTSSIQTSVRNNIVPHMVTVGDPDFQSPPYVEIKPNGQSRPETQLHPTARSDLHNSGAHTLYTMQSVMNGDYLKQNQQEVDFNNQPISQRTRSKSQPTEKYVVYAVTPSNRNVFAVQHQPINPQYNSPYTQQNIQTSPQNQFIIPQGQNLPYSLNNNLQGPVHYNAAYNQQNIQTPHQPYQSNFEQQPNVHYQNAAYTQQNQQQITHGPLAFSSSYYNHRVPNSPVNNYQHHSQYVQAPGENYVPVNNVYTQQNSNLQNIQAGQHFAQYTQPQNVIFYQQPQHQFLPQQINNANAGPIQAPQFENQQQNLSSNAQLNQDPTVNISFNESDSYPLINIRNDDSSTQNPQVALDNNDQMNNSLTRSDLPQNNFRGDIVFQQDSQPQPSSIENNVQVSDQYVNSPSVNVKYQPNDNQKQILDYILATRNQEQDQHNYQNSDSSVKTRVISATPAPKYGEPAGERVHTRRIVVNQPIETVEVVQEKTPITNIKQVTVQQPTVYKTSTVGLKRVETSVPIFIPPQNLPGYGSVHYNQPNVHYSQPNVNYNQPNVHYSQPNVHYSQPNVNFNYHHPQAVSFSYVNRE